MKALRTVGSYLLIGGFIGALMYLGNRLIDTIKTNFFSIELVLLLAGIYLACVAFGMLFFLIADTNKIEQHSDGPMLLFLAMLFVFSAFPLLRLIDKVFKTKFMEGVNMKE